jgi:hypothetical protein
MANLYDMTDEELEAAFKEAKAEQGSPDVGKSFDSEPQEDEEETVEDLEQPDEDSDDDTSTEEETEEEAEKESEPETDEPDGVDAAEEDKPAKQKDKVEADVQPAQKTVVKANGKEFEFTDEEIKKQFPKVFAQAMDYTRKTQTIKPWRQTIDALEQANLSHNDVSLMIDVLKGNKAAVAEVIKKSGVDLIDIDNDAAGTYVPTNYGRNDTELTIKEIVDEISADKEYEVTHRVLAKEWDEQSWDEMRKKPKMIKMLHEDVKSGIFGKISPIAEKLKMYDGGTKTDLQYYAEAANVYAEETRQSMQQNDLRTKAVDRDTKLKAVKSKQESVNRVREESAKRKAASPTKLVGRANKVVSYLDESDEAFDEWYKKLQDRI